MKRSHFKGRIIYSALRSTFWLRRVLKRNGSKGINSVLYTLYSILRKTKICSSSPIWHISWKASLLQSNKFQENQEINLGMKIRWGALMIYSIKTVLCYILWNFLLCVWDQIYNWTCQQNKGLEINGGMNKLYQNFIWELSQYMQMVDFTSKS